MSKFYSFKVIEIESLTIDSVQISFEHIFPDLFKFKAGQYITIRKDLEGEDVRRSYSISSCPGDRIEIGVKLVKNGLMSTFLTKKLKVGDVLDIMPPTGSFYLNHSEKSNHHVAICSGSGITPILSMIRYVVRNDPDSYFTLIYGNRARNSIMFSDELKKLEKDFQSQVLIFYAFSREKTINYIHGRIDADILTDLFSSNNNLGTANSYYLCGPGEMIDNTNEFLINHGIKKDKINFERFNTTIKSDNIKDKSISEEISSNVTVSVDGDDFDFILSSNGDTILEAAMNAGADVPFSCKGGVCCVCKAKVISGEVEMDQNFSLSDEEVADGYILTCQSHPLSENVVVDFDEI